MLSGPDLVFNSSMLNIENGLARHYLFADLRVGQLLFSVSKVMVTLTTHRLILNNIVYNFWLYIPYFCNKYVS
jgi:hypothetical protein